MDGWMTIRQTAASSRRHIHIHIAGATYMSFWVSCLDDPGGGKGKAGVFRWCFGRGRGRWRWSSSSQVCLGMVLCHVRTTKAKLEADEGMVRARPYLMGLGWAGLDWIGNRAIFGMEWSEMERSETSCIAYRQRIDESIN